LSLAADLTKAGGDHDGASHAFGDTLLQRREDLGRRHRNDGEIDALL
jgi:hypothetical protein